MADTLFDAVREVARIVGGARTGLVVSGGTNLITDTTLRAEADDFWNDGTALVLTTTDGAAPQKEWAVIDDWTQSTAAASMKSLFTAATEQGDRYMFIPPKYPLDWIIDKINMVLMSTRIVAIDTTSLDMTAEQTVYALPTGYTRANLRQVWVQTVNDSDNPEWMALRNWNVEYDGSSHNLILDTRIGRSIHNRLNGFAIKLISTPYHAEIFTASSEIDDLIHLDRIAYHAAEFLLLDELSRNTGDKFIANRLNWTIDQKEKAIARHPIFLPEWHEKGSGW